MGIMFKNKLNLHLSCNRRAEDYILKLTLSPNQTGIIYRVTAVLFAYGWDIKEANFETLDGIVKDVFVIQNTSGQEMTDLALRKIQSDLHELFFQDLAVIDYLERFSIPPALKKDNKPAVVHIFNPKTVDSTVLDVRTTDRPGLLFEISQLLYLLDVDIVSVVARTEDGNVRDTFLLRKTESEQLEEETMHKIKEGLLKFL